MSKSSLYRWVVMSGWTKGEEGEGIEESKMQKWRAAC